MAPPPMPNRCGPTVLVAINCERSVDALITTLHREGFRTGLARSGRDALSMYDDVRHRLVLLDLVLADLSGLEVCHRLRRRYAVPIVMLTQEGIGAEPEIGLDLGADDYVSWPHRERELTARLRAVLRRAYGHRPDALAHEPIEVDNLQLDPVACQLTIDGQRVDIPRQELSLLEILLDNAGRIVPKDTLAMRLWGPGYDPSTRRLETNVKRLRTRLVRGSSRHGRIATAARIGYRYEPASAP